MSDLFHNEGAEENILYLLMVDDDLQKQIIPKLIPEEFSSIIYQNVFRVISGMYSEKKAIDLVSVSAELDGMYDNDTALMYEQELVRVLRRDNFQAKYDYKRYIEIVKETAVRRTLLNIIENAKDELLNTQDDTSAILEQTRQSLRDIVVTNHSWRPISQVMNSTFAALERKAKGEELAVPSGISPLDGCTAGFFKGELTIIGARPAVGKSAMGAHIAMAAAEKGFNVGICSREMSEVQYGTRIISRNTDVNNTHMRNGELTDDEWDQIVRVIGPTSSLPVHFMFSTRYIEDLRMEVQKQVDSGQLDLLLVDYVQLMQSKQRFEKDYLRIAYVSKMLKDMTVDFNIAIIALAQVGRSVDKDMPSLADLRGSGDLEQDADNVIFMHRPADANDRYVHPKDRASFDNLKDNGLQYIVLNIAKQRQGQTGAVAVVFDPSHMRYVPILREGA